MPRDLPEAASATVAAPGGVLHLPDELFEDVLQEQHGGRLAGAVTHLGEVASGTAHHGQRILQVGVFLHGDHVMDPLGGKWRIHMPVGVLRGAQHVLEMHIADRRALRIHDHVA